jgi:glycosyltransferase involved in cell wall biosynthesis
MKRKVLLIIPNLGRGGAQRVFHQQLKYLSNDFDVMGCVFNWDGAFEEDKASNIVSLNVSGGVTLLQKIRTFILRIIRLRKLKRENKIDISISHLEGADYVNLLSRGSDKTICWIHGTKKFDRNITGPLGVARHHVLMPILYRRAQKIVTVSNGIRDEMKDSYKGMGDLLQTIYNGFDREFIQTQSLVSVDNNFLKLTKISKTIITHCRLSKQKNLLALIHIFKELIRTTNSKLIIIGDGELRDELIQGCQLINLETWTFWGDDPWSEVCDVFFLGQKQNPFKYLHHASLYIMTSDWEGFPLALCEAMVCGIPVVASDCNAGPREILDPSLNLTQPITMPHNGKYGVLMPMAESKNQLSIGKWVNELQRILRDEELLKKYAWCGAERIKDFKLTYSIEQTVRLLQEIG